MLQALREALEAAAPLGASSSGRGGSSTGESIREGLVQVRQPANWIMADLHLVACHEAPHCQLLLQTCLPGTTFNAPPRPTCQIVGCVGTRMRSHHAHTLLLGIMITQLDRAPPVRALAAEALLSEAGARLWVGLR